MRLLSILQYAPEQSSSCSRFRTNGNMCAVQSCNQKRISRAWSTIHTDANRSKIGWGRGITEARDQAFGGALPLLVSSKNLKIDCFRVPCKQHHHSFCRSKPTSPSQVKEVAVKMLLILDPRDPHFNPHPLPWPHRR